MTGSTIHRTIRLLGNSLGKLGADIPLSELEHAGVLVNNGMSVQGRSFHTPEHIFDLADESNPYLSLAALFHDLVYYHVDAGFIPEIGRILAGSIDITDSAIKIRKKSGPKDRPLRVCMLVFGFEPGHELSPFGGMNEFLSALVLNRLLSEAVSERDRFITTACVEATIPFRGYDENGKSPADGLESRLIKANKELGLGLSDEEIVETVEWSVEFANRDVRNFAEEDVALFLDNTWKLLPETNPSLRTGGVYSISSYRSALQKMEGFLNFLKPDAIFYRYRNVPTETEYNRLLELSGRNVKTAREYLGMKLLTAGILEALAAISGGDAPVALFMGGIESDDPASKIDHYLPEVDDERTDTDPVLYNLLAYGRASASSFDLQNSPLSLFIYRLLGSDGFHSRLDAAKKFFEGDLTAGRFLDELPASMIGPIARACSVMAITRTKELEAYADSRK